MLESAPPKEPQSASAVLMVRPARFGFNPQTAASNVFQKNTPGTGAGRAPTAPGEMRRAFTRRRCASSTRWPSNSRGPACKSSSSHDSVAAGEARRDFSEQLGELSSRRHGGALSDDGAQPASGAPRRGARRGRSPGVPHHAHRGFVPPRGSRSVPRGHRQPGARSSAASSPTRTSRRAPISMCWASSRSSSTTTW